MSPQMADQKDETVVRKNPVWVIAVSWMLVILAVAFLLTVAITGFRGKPLESTSVSTCGIFGCG